MPLEDWIEQENFNPGYLMRGLDQMPRRGDKPEWRHNQDYWREREEFPQIDIAGPEFVYDGKRSTQGAGKPLETAIVDAANQIVVPGPQLEQVLRSGQVDV